jgi:hypothetical protein
MPQLSTQLGSLQQRRIGHCIMRPRAQTSRDFNDTRSNPATGWRTPRASRLHTPKRGRNGK